MKQKRGPGNNQRKLNDNDIKLIRQMLKDNVSDRQIASRFNVSPNTIWKIKVGYTYKDKKPSSLFYINRT